MMILLNVFHYHLLKCSKRIKNASISYEIFRKKILRLPHNIWRLLPIVER